MGVLGIVGRAVGLSGPQLGGIGGPEGIPTLGITPCGPMGGLIPIGGAVIIDGNWGGNAFTGGSPGMPGGGIPIAPPNMGGGTFPCLYASAELMVKGFLRTYMHGQLASEPVLLTTFGSIHGRYSYESARCSEFFARMASRGSGIYHNNRNNTYEL